MHKVTINSPNTNTEVDNNYEAIIFIGIPQDDRLAMECLLLGKNTDDAAIDATVKTKLLHALRKMEDMLIKSNKLVELASLLDPNFTDQLIEGKTMDMDQYKLRQAIRGILNEGKE